MTPLFSSSSTRPQGSGIMAVVCLFYDLAQLDNRQSCLNLARGMAVIISFDSAGFNLFARELRRVWWLAVGFQASLEVRLRGLSRLIPSQMSIEYPAR
jgi:hypothetical protein